MADWVTMGLGFLAAGLGLGWALGRMATQASLSRLWLSRQDVERDYVSRPLHEALQQQTDVYQENWQEAAAAERALGAQLAEAKAHLMHLSEKLGHQEQEVRRLQDESKLVFENVANRLLEEKSQRFSALNQQQLQDVLKPLREKIQTFEEQIERRFVEETRDRVSLKKELEQLRELNQQLSADANQLAQALKGDSKTQGDWGELQLERLLEKAGLQTNVHYRTQSSFRDEDGRQKRPDFIIHLPDDRHLIIDCKVSLTAYERYCHANDPAEQERQLRAHIDSLRRHVRDLSGKNYQQLYQINSPDYLLLFVPIEPAYNLAARHDDRLFAEAFDQNIVMVTASTLLATLRTVSFIWKQEKQKRSVQEIARQSGLLYDKFVAFVEDLRQVGLRLDQAQGVYQDAMRKLADGKRYGDTLVGRAERLRELGAETTKRLPAEFGPEGEDDLNKIP